MDVHSKNPEALTDSQTARPTSWLRHLGVWPRASSLPPVPPLPYLYRGESVRTSAGLGASVPDTQPAGLTGESTTGPCPHRAHIRRGTETGSPPEPHNTRRQQRTTGQEAGTKRPQCMYWRHGGQGGCWERGLQAEGVGRAEAGSHAPEPVPGERAHFHFPRAPLPRAPLSSRRALVRWPGFQKRPVSQLALSSGSLL